MTLSEHTVKAYDDELKKLDELVVRMGGLAESQMAAAIDAITRGDERLAQRAIVSDDEIDRLEQEVEQAVIRMLALRQPAGQDLRMIVSVLRISSDLERIGDYAANVAKRAIALRAHAPQDPLRSLPRMVRLVQGSLDRVLDAFVKRDSAKALDVWESDREIDEMYTSLFRETLTYMMEDPRNITPCAHLLFIAKNIERIGDHCTNIAELIHYMVTGKRLTGHRPKGDESSYVVVEPDA